jgi:hypothetical protein
LMLNPAQRRRTRVWGQRETISVPTDAQSLGKDHSEHGLRNNQSWLGKLPD